MGMSMVKIDERGRILIPQNIRNAVKIHSEEQFNLILEDDKIILKRIKNLKISKKKDSLKDLLDNPIHVDPKKIKENDLDKIEDEMWSS